MRRLPPWFASAILAIAASAAAAQERIIGLPCEGCEGALVGRPTEIAAIARIAPAGEKGQPLQLRGRIVDADRKSAAGVIVYGYHTDASGDYPGDAQLHGTPASQHGRLRGWARSDAAGNYGFDTIRPAGYPGRRNPAHIHLHIIEPGRCTYYIDDVNFRDDPRLQVSTRQPAQRGGGGVAEPVRDANGTWQVTRDIVLGKNIADYANCGG